MKPVGGVAWGVVARASLSAALAAALCGCAAGARRVDPSQPSLVCYLDGAGGGSVLTNWGVGVREGLRLADYRSEFLHFVWQTGLGMAADQAASVEYKRGKARELARRLRAHMDARPGQAVQMIGLSAGTALAAFTLEELPESHPVENVVFLGSSLSCHYDLTKALRRVRGRLYVYTSDNDVMLAALVPIAGTADRQYCGACAAGLRGFHWPPQADPQLARLYAKVENIAWRPEFARAGNFGGHTDAVNAEFVRHYVAPLFRELGPRYTAAGDQPEVVPPASPSAPPPGATFGTLGRR